MHIYDRKRQAESAYIELRRTIKRLGMFEWEKEVGMLSFERLNTSTTFESSAQSQNCVDVGRQPKTDFATYQITSVWVKGLLLARINVGLRNKLFATNT